MHISFLSHAALTSTKNPALLCNHPCRLFYTLTRKLMSNGPDKHVWG